MISVSQALDHLFALTRRLPGEEVPLREAAGRIAALRHPQLFTAQHVPVAGDDRRQEHETDEDNSESFFLHDHTIAAAPIARPLNPGDNSL